MGIKSGILWTITILLVFTKDYTTAQTQRSLRSNASPRSLGSNPKQSSSNLVDFDCPDEFGYFPHPSDCSLYYVCVFGGALLESCTGGLMYSHELQTCDWPRNVGCDLPSDGIPASPPPRQQQLSSRIRFSSIPREQTSSTSQLHRENYQREQVQSQQQRQPQIQREQLQQREQQQLPRESYRIESQQREISVSPSPQTQLRNLLPSQPFEHVAPNPVITSRGQPKILEEHEDIAKLYAETHETLPPVEEEESDRQQRVYRGQPSTVGQVQRDRDGIVQQSYNSIPNHGKVGSYSYTAAAQQPQPQPVQQFRVESSSQGTNNYGIQSQKNVNNVQKNRNYYNTTTNQQNYDQQFDNYYALYDDEVDLYRDVDYAQQPQYSTQKVPAVKQTTYRPTTTQTPPPPPPQRETYIIQQKPQYERPAPIQPTQQVYADDYSDDELIAQIQEDTFSNIRGQTPVRGDINEINLISERPVLVSSTLRTKKPQPQYPTTTRYVKTQETITYPKPTTKPTTTTTTTTTTTSTTTPASHIVTRTNTRTRGGSHYNSQSPDQPSTVTSNRGTHPPRARPTLKPSQSIVSKAQEFVDIYRFPPSRPDPVYPQPIPDKTAARCRKDVCLLPDCFCGGKDIPGDMPVEQVPQIVLLTFDDSVNDLNKQLYQDLFEKGRVNPNGCPISATFYVSHEWTDYSQVQNLYSDGHEMASHTVSHSFGEQFSQKKWTREIAGQREILSAYGGVKLEDVRGMRAPFLSIGGNKMFKMLYDSNFTYDSSMPIYENRPPSYPYTLDYKIFHDCMIPPCPTRSYPGVWEVPMVMWQDLNGGRCSMGDACANPPDAENVTKMLMKNFDRHYTTNRAPFGLYYHAAWFTQPHHKEGFITFLDIINKMDDVWIVTNWQALQWVRDPTPISRINSFQPFQCNYSDRPKRCNNPKVCNLWHKSGVRYMRTCQPCPDIYPWTGKTGIRSSRIDNEIEE